MITEEENINNTLSAGLSKIPISDYIKQQEATLALLGDIEQKVENIKINSMETYQKGYKIKQILSSLFCYTFNNDKMEDWNKVADIEGKMGNKLFKYARNYKKITPAQRKLGKYLLWNSHFIRENTNEIVDALIAADMLRKQGCNYFIIGIHLSTGDNTFGIDTNGKEYRHYIPVCCFMAIGITYEYDNLKEIFDTKEIPELEDYYEKYYQGNCKHGVKISFSRKDREYIRQNYCCY